MEINELTKSSSELRWRFTWSWGQGFSSPLTKRAWLTSLDCVGCVIVEVKAVERFDSIHTAQMLTYLKLSGHQVGLLMNFNVVLLRDGIRRIVLGLPESPRRPQRPRR